MTSDIRKNSTNSVETSSRIAQLGTQTQAGILLLLAGLVSFLSFSGQVPQPAAISGLPLKYYMLMVTTVIVVMNGFSIFTTLRGKQALGYSLSYFSMFIFLLGIVLLIQGRVFFISIFMLVATTLGLRWMCPPQYRRQYLIATVLVLALAWGLEWVNPPWRAVYSGARFGPIAALIFALIFSIFLAFQTWQGNIRLKLVTAFTVIALVSVTILGTTAYLYFQDRIRDEVRQRLLNTVNIAAIQFDGDLHSQIQDAEDMNLPAYQKLEQEGKKIVKADSDLIFYYTMRMNDEGQIYFIIDSRPTDEKPVDVGTIYEQPSPLLLERFNTLDGPMVEEEVYTDEYGSVLSAYAPLYRSDGSFEGIIGIDISADNMLAHERSILYLILGSSVSVLLIVILLGVWLGGVFVGPIINLSRVTQKVSEGDLNARAVIETTDEVGDLAKAFNVMTGQLQETLSGLEKRVAQRTQALAASGEISRQLSSIRDKETLAREVVRQLQASFNYYHAHIYLMDETGIHLVMTGGTGEVGAILLSQGHKIPTGKGLVGRAAERKEVILVPDISRDPNWLPNPLLPETKAEIAVPIMAGHNVLGVLDVQNNVLDSLTDQDASLLRSIADQAAIALQNISATENVTKRADELQKVAKVSTVASSIIDDEQKMLAQVVQLTQRQFGLYHAHIYLYDPAEQVLQVKACGWKEGDKHAGTHGDRKIPLAQEQSLVSRSARTREPVIVNDVRLEPSWLPNPLMPDTLSELAVPLVFGETLIGVLDVQSDRVNAFSEEDASIQSILASQIATALQNVRTYSQTRRQADYETLLSSINQKIQSTTTVESALKITVRELGRVLGTQTQVKLKSVDGQEAMDTTVEESRS